MAQGSPKRLVMTLLVADVGGTNTRLGLVGSLGGVSEIVQYENARFASFLDVLAQYCAGQETDALQGVCVAVAGPVASGVARLTNLDWCFDADAIAAALAVAPGAVHLINDLAALGYSLGGLGSDQLAAIRPARAATNHQALVAGLGTGFNVCVVRDLPAGPVVIAAELGHAGLPGVVHAAIAQEVGSDIGGFATIEDLFSGRGLSRLFQALSGTSGVDGAQIMADYVPERRDVVARTVDLYACTMGILARELVFLYQPFGGIHFAGAVSRGILSSAAQAAFLKGLEAPGVFADHVAQVPVYLITDDAAALTGGARFLQAQGAD